LGTGNIGDRYITVKVEVDRKPLDEALARLTRNGCISPEAAEDILCASWANGNELIALEFVSEPWRAACRVIMKPGKRLLDLLCKENGGG
jgi:hypothetical protein